MISHVKTALRKRESITNKEFKKEVKRQYRIYCKDFSIWLRKSKENCWERLCTRNYEIEAMNMFLNKLRNKGYNVEKTTSKALDSLGSNCFTVKVRLVPKEEFKHK